MVSNTDNYSKKEKNHFFPKGRRLSSNGNIVQAARTFIPFLNIFDRIQSFDIIKKLLRVMGRVRTTFHLWVYVDNNRFKTFSMDLSPMNVPASAVTARCRGAAFIASVLPTAKISGRTIIHDIGHLK